MADERKWMSVTDSVNYSASQISAVRYPVTKFEWVNGGDIDAINYVAGCEGKVKKITEYADKAKTMIASITTFKYQDTLNPTKSTEIISELG